jgi:CHAT domain-containing protein/Tfp pilus assembly protein PilF
VSRTRAIFRPALRAWLMLSLAAVVLAMPLPAADEPATNTAQQSLADAEQLYRHEGPEAALPVFEDLVKAFHGSGDKLNEAVAIGFVGEIHWRLGDYPQARDHLQQALATKRDAGDRLGEAKTLNVLGLLHWDLGEFEQAQAYLHEGSAIAAELDDKQLQGAILNNLSLVHDELGDYYVSLEQYQRALDLYQGADFPRGEGDTLGNIGGVYLLLGRYQEALEHYQRALAISTQLDSAIAMSQDHGNIGLCYLGLGQTDSALEHLGRAIELSVQAGMQQDEAFWLGARGNGQLLKGLYDLALDDHRAALALYEQIEGKTEAVEALHDMGRLYLMLGDSGSAENHFRQSMELAREIGLARGVTGNLLALGDLRFRQNQFEAAAELYRGAVERAQESGEMVSRSEGLLRLAAVHRDQQRLAEAAETSAEALEIAHKTGAPGLISQALYEQAELGRLQRMPAVALAHYEEALAVLARSPDPELQWQVLYGKGLTLADTGDRAGAISALESAVMLIEGVRDRLHEERFKAGYVQDKYQVYVDLVRLQLEAGREQEAFSTAERLRSRSYLDLVETGVPVEAGSREELLEFTMQERIRTLREALAEEANRDRPEQRQLAIEVYSQELLAAEQEYQALLDDQRSASMARTRTRAPSYGQVSASLAADEALVEYVVGSESVMVFIVTRRALVTATMPIRRQDLVNKVELVRALIRGQDSEHWKKPAASLARFLVDPFMASGQMENIHHLYLVPHGNLNYLPFALLPSHGGEDDHRLVEDFTLAYLPTAAALLRDRGASANTSSMLALAPAASRLEFAFDEARAVDTLFQPDSRALLGTFATESSFKQLAPQYRLLHLATHGYFNKLNPMLSGLQLEADAVNDGRLELHEILGLRLDADLVTLSACQTGLGSGYFAELPAGDDFVGLTRAFLYAGSTSVLATLWEVDDASTLALMKTFYGGLRQAAGAEDMAKALSLAQRALLSSKKYNHPYFWAPFVLVGEMGRDRGQRI